MEVCVKAGGALSGEHGIGTEKQDYMRLVFNEEDLQAMKKLRAAFVQTDKNVDVEKFNPDKIFPRGPNDGETYRLNDPEFYPTGTEEWA